MIITHQKLSSISGRVPSVAMALALICLACSKSPAEQPAKPDIQATQPAATEKSLAKVAPLVATAKSQAQVWQKDAVLVGVFIKAGADGRIDTNNLMSPTNMNGSSVTIMFYSAGTKLVQTYGLDPTGHIVPQGPPMPPGTEITLIPEPFLDLDAAIAKAGEGGFKLPKPSPQSFVDARITGVENANGKSNSAIWKLTAMDFSGPTPVFGQPVEINAASGTETSWEKESGQLERSQLADKLSKGKLLSVDPKRDLSVYRQEADSMAAKWSPDLKLGEIRLGVRDMDGQLQTVRAHYYYFRPTNEGWSTFHVACFQTQVDDGKTRESKMLITASEPQGVIPKSEHALQSLPDSVLSPSAAMVELAKLDPRWPDESRSLQLFFGDNPSLDVDQPGTRFDAFPEESRDAVSKKWLWVTLGDRTRQERTDIFVYDRPISVPLAIDAVSGDLVITSPTASPNPSNGKSDSGKPANEPVAKNRPSDEKPSANKKEARETKVDPAIVGEWEGRIDEADIKATLTYTISATGEYTLSIKEEGQPAIKTTGTIAAKDGQWTLTTSGSGQEKGSYQLTDPNTLTWTEGGGKPVVLKKRK